MKGIRIVAIAATLLLAGCVSDYAYRGGSGDYYYSHPSAYGQYGAPYSSVGYGYPGGWYGSIGYGYGYGSLYRYYPGYGYYRPYPYYYYRPHRPHRPHRPDPPDDDRPDRPSGPVTGGQRPPMARPHPAANHPAYTRLPARGGQSLRRPTNVGQGEPHHEAPRLRRGGQQPLARPQPQAPMRAAIPQQSRPAPQRVERPAPRMERPAPRAERAVAPRATRDQEP